MYIASNFVRSRTGAEGINAFLHLHRDQNLPLRASGAPDVDAVSTLDAGYLIARHVEVPPGGNDVLAHLDLVGADAATEASLSAAVRAVGSRIGETSVQIDVLEDGVAARFGSVIAFDGDRAGRRQIVDRLWSAARPLLSQREDPPWRASGPYVVWAEPAADGIRLWLPPTTLARLPQSARRRARITIPRGQPLPGSVADSLRDVALMLLDLTEGDVVLAGGVEIVDPRTATVFLTHPPPVKA